MENVNFLQKPLELATSSQKSIAKIRSVAAEISKFYVPITANFSPFFNILFSFIYQQILFNETINKLTLTRFTIHFPYNLWTDQPRQFEEEIPAEIEQPSTAYLPNFLIAKKLKPSLIADYSALATMKSNVSFLPNLLLAKNLTSNLAAPLAEQPSIHVLTPEITFLEPAVSQGIDSTKLVTTSLQEPRLKKAARPEEKYSYPASGLSSAWFLPSFLLAQKIASDLIVALAEQPSQAALSQKTTSFLKSETAESLVQKEKPIEPALPQEATPLPNTETTEKVAKKEKTSEETPEISHVNQMIKWQSDLASKISPSIENIASLAQYEESAVPLVLSLATFETTLSGFTGLRPLEVPPSAALPSEKAAVENIIAEYPSIAKVSKEARPPQLQQVSISEAAPSELTVGTKLTSKSLSSFGYATVLPALILEKQTPFLRIAAALSQASSLPIVTPAPRTEPPYSYPMVAAQTILPVTSSQMTLLAKEIFPSLTSWIYEGSELLRPTGIPLSAVPIAASSAEKIVSETLIQPMSTFIATPPHDYGKPAIWEGEEKLSRLPTVLALAGAGSLITNRLQHELVALTGEKETVRKPFVQISPGVSGGVTPVRALGTTAISEVAKEIATGLYAVVVPAGRAAAQAQTSEAALIAGSVTAISKLAVGLAAGASYKAVAAQASRAALLAGSAVATAELSARLMGAHYVEAATETSAKTFARATAQASQAAAVALVASSAAAVSELAAGASAEAVAGISAVTGARTAFGEALTQSRQPEMYIQSPLPVSQLPSKPLSIAPIIQNNLSFIPDEASEEEDLRDLERKIRKILSEQISRYYGSSMI